MTPCLTTKERSFWGKRWRALQQKVARKTENVCAEELDAMIERAREAVRRERRARQ